MSDWDDVAEAWIKAADTHGDKLWGPLLDPVLWARISPERHRDALDVGCGEGRFCRQLAKKGIRATGIDPTKRLTAEARRRDPDGRYEIAGGEALPFADESFDLVVSYLSLIDIPDFRSGIAEMARVLRPEGTLLVANLSPFETSYPTGWARSKAGRPLHYTGERYMDEFSDWVEFLGLRVQNWHRPLSAYMEAFLASGFVLRFFAEPQPTEGDAKRLARFRAAPRYVVMEWQRGPAATSPLPDVNPPR